MTRDMVAAVFGGAISLSGNHAPEEFALGMLGMTIFQAFRIVINQREGSVSPMPTPLPQELIPVEEASWSS